MRIDRTLSQQLLNATGMLKSLRHRELRDKSLVYASFAPGKLYVVERGYVRLVLTQSDGRQLTRMLLGQGALFGDLPFSPVTFKSEELAVVSGATQVLEINRAEVEQVSRRDGEFRQLLLECLATRMQFLDRRLQWQLTSPLLTRVAMILADLMCFAGGRCSHHGQGQLVDIRMTHEEFAELADAARPTVSVILEDLRDQEIIQYHRSYLCLLDLDALRHIAES